MEFKEFKPFKIGKYLLLERLATGGMAEVYRAKASGAGGFEKQLAIKRILPTYSADEEFRRMFEYEARLSSMLTHSNIVQVYDFVKFGETYLLAMEYVDGKNLRQFVNKAKKLNIPVPIEFGIFVINEVCQGLDYAHKKKDDLTGKPLNIIHRDMSPQNIMISYEGAVKIVDFGIAKAKDRIDETRAGVIKGKFGYMSPEQANGESVDHHTDIFSTGIILYELLTGKRLFASDNDMATLKLIQECTIASPSRINPKITLELEKIILKALTKDTRLRFQEAGTFHRQLQEYLNKYFPSFTQREIAELQMKVFKEEIEAEKKRFEQIYRQSIPFSQKDDSQPQNDFAGLEEALEGDITKSEVSENTAVTIVEEFPSEEFPPAQEPQEESPERTQVSNPDKNFQEFFGQPAPVIPQNPEVTSSKIIPVEEEQASQPSENTSNTEAATWVKKGPEIGPSSTEQTGSQRFQSLEPISLDEATPTFERREKSGSYDKNSADVANKIDFYNSENTKADANPDQIPNAKSWSYHPAPSIIDNPEGGVDASKKRLEISVYRSGWTPILLVCLVLAIGFYYYRDYLDEQISQVRNPTDVPNTKVSNGKDPEPDEVETPEVPVQNKVSKNQCVFNLESDPPGARVFVGNQERGITPAQIPGECGQQFVVNLVMTGFETTNQALVYSKTNNRILISMKKVPIGSISLQLSHNAKVYIDGSFIGEYSAGQDVDVQVSAGKKHKVRFVNSIFEIDQESEFSVDPEKVLREKVQLKPRQ